ncbi:glycogen synthase isoform 1 [Clydaea vesicula]|uniref:Glycogen [starch] synthase n=1 Tax=Clydaea vesicula TaxID=447962 RepID=A0AAD5TVE0_9FUNG|nr:glycogen synthase isoform 1 [Clydaea vesicula]
MTQNLDVANPLLFEIAWEVANKVGGIYTVLKSKTPVTVNEYGERYCLIGPLNHATAPMEVDPIEHPHNPALDATLMNMRQHGVQVMYGRWLVEGAPFVLLFDVRASHHRMNEWKADLWNTAGIPSPEDDNETNEAIVFGYLVAWFFGEMLKNSETESVKIK